MHPKHSTAQHIAPKTARVCLPALQRKRSSAKESSKHQKRSKSRKDSKRSKKAKRSSKDKDKDKKKRKRKGGASSDEDADKARHKLSHTEVRHTPSTPTAACGCALCS